MQQAQVLFQRREQQAQVREFQLPAGPCDYLLFIDGKAAGVIEAKKQGVTLSALWPSSLRGRYRCFCAKNSSIQKGRMSPSARSMR